MKTIVAVAVNTEHSIYWHELPYTHVQLRYTMRRAGVTKGVWQDGFLASDSKFYSRVDAMLIARASGQLKEPKNDFGGILYSEDISWW